MKIIGGRDYYDNVLAYGRDESIVLVRKRDWFLKAEDVPYVMPEPRYRFLDADDNIIPDPLHKLEVNYINGFVHKNLIYLFRPAFVVIGDKMWHGVDIVSLEQASRYYWQEAKRWFFWSLDPLMEWCRDRGVYKVMTDSVPRHVPLTLGQNVVPHSLLSWMIENKITILRWCVRKQYEQNGDRPWQANGDCLKDIQFYQVLGAEQVYQEIAMWVGGVLPGSANPMVEISDQIRAAKHGMDKWSFRRPPSKK